MSQSLPVGRAAHVARSLWLRIFGTGGNPGASLTDVKGFLDVLQWRVNDEINETEFTHLVAQWTKRGRAAKRRGVVAEVGQRLDDRLGQLLQNLGPLAWRFFTTLWRANASSSHPRVAASRSVRHQHVRHDRSDRLSIRIPHTA